MTERSEVVSHLSIKGFTLNPLKNKDLAKRLLLGLGTTYEKKHNCDWDSSVIHSYHFEGIIPESINCNYIQDKGSRGMIGFAALVNGYYVLRIWDEYEPAQIEFNVYVRGDLDPDICLDHLKAPYSKIEGDVDGLGMFDFSYSIVKEPLPFNQIMKQDKELRPYAIDAEGHKALDIISCYRCPMQAKYWGILPPIPNKTYRDKVENSWMQENYENGFYDNSFMSVPVCENHRNDMEKE
jgi:hypothetical protein